jgi:hypothetical protein
VAESSLNDARGDNNVTVFHGGVVLTMDADFSTAESLAIRGDRILAVGDHAAVSALAGADAQYHDISGRTLMPGFIDAHTHPVVGSATGVFHNVGITRFASVEGALAEMARMRGQSDWLLFKDLDLATQSFAEPAVTRRHLDAVSTVHPVVVWHAGGHRMTVNTPMLDRLGITSATPDPDDSSYGRFADGTPDGNIAGLTALLAALAAIEPFEQFDRESGAVGLAQSWVATGLTAVGIANVTSPDDWQVIKRLGDRAEFPLRTRSYLLWKSLAAWDQAGIGPGQGDAKTRIVGWKAVADGSNQAFTGLQRKPYLGKSAVGLAYMTPEALYEAVALGTARGGQLAIHGNGDAGIDNIIAAVDRALDAGVDVRRPRIEHCSIVQDDQLAALRELGISCSFLIAHVRYWGSAFVDRVFGSEKAAKLDRAGSFERAAIPFSLHSDYSVSSLSPLAMVEVAMTREMYGSDGEVLSEAEVPSLEAALRAVTSVPAWQMLSEHEIGSLEPGKFADMVVLARDPRDVAPTELAEIEVLQTWINGHRVH